MVAQEINDFEVSEEFGKFLIKGTINFCDMSRKIRGARKGEPPVIKNHNFLNFKGIKKISFKNSTKNFEWGNIHNIFDEMSSHEAYFRANYEWDFMEYSYNKKFKKLPGIYRISQDCYDKSFITDFFSFLKPPTTSYIAIERFGNKRLELNEFTVALEEGLYLNFDTEELSFYYDKEKHLVDDGDDNFFYYILRLLASYMKKSYEKNKIHVVFKGDYGFDKTAFDVRKINIDIDDNYNDDFKEVSSTIINRLNNKNYTGLYILNGVPGTGKTSWIRYLSGKINRNIIFVSPDMVDYITDPAFIPFLMNNSDSVLIIEDAEPALQARDGSRRSGAISNILNLTDGLLSDCLNISIVATFNTSTQMIDAALLRKGRLVQSYTFEKLVANKSKKLLKKIGFGDVKVKESMTLSDIYFYGEDNKSELFNKKKIGFKK